jgi:CubicO group peptidase (beta-lactamase class C family)
VYAQPAGLIGDATTGGEAISYEEEASTMPLRPLGVGAVPVILKFPVGVTAARTPPAAARTAAAAPLESFHPAGPSLDPAAARAIDAHLKKIGSNGIVVIQNGKVLHQTVAPGVKADQPFNTWSMAKTFTASLVGIAIDQKLIKSLDQPISDFLPELKPKTGVAGFFDRLLHPHNKQAGEVTIRQVLSGTSGVKWDLVGDSSMAMLAGDKSKVALGRGMDAAPGTKWRYNNTAIQLLEVVLRRALEQGVAAGRTDLKPTAKDPNIVEAFARKFLWEPVGMGPETSWEKDKAGHVTVYTSVNASFDALAKFGAMLMNGGKVGNRQVVPRAFVDEMTRPSQSLNPNYGLLTWVKAPAASHLTNTNTVEKGTIMPAAPDGAFAVEGMGQNFVVAVPQQNLLIVHLKPAPVLARNDNRPKNLGNAIDDLGDFVHDADRADQDKLVALVLGGLRS